MKTHTPGPWHVVSDPQWEGKHPNHSHRFICNVPAFAEVYPPTDGEDDGWQVFHDNVGRTICHMTDTIEIESNARLIASAPELLAIVRALLPYASNEWTRLDDLAHRGNRESEDSAMQLDRLIEHARETIEEIIGDNE
jgi:hypothetical protein